MENHIKKLSPRVLSLQGKVILINSLILSKTSYLTNIFPIKTETMQNIHNQMFQYIWKNKTSEPIARKTIYLNKKGGLKLLEPETHNYAMRIKHLLTLKQKDNPPLANNVLANNRYLQLFKGISFLNRKQQSQNSK